MSISTTATKDTYVGNASISTPYPVTFKYLSSDHVTVYADGVDITNSCTFAGDGTTGTGEFTTAAYAPTTTIVVVLDVPFDQPVVLQETGSLPAKTIEVEGFDRLNMQVRRVWRKLQDVLTFNTDEAGASTGTADNLIGFDGSGDIAEIPNTTFLQTANNLSELANAPDQAAAQTNLNVDPAGTDNSINVTKTGAGTYISLAGQVLTVDAITESDIVNLGAYIENITGSPLSELQDVTITTPSTSQVLAWNGSAWVNTAAGNGDALTANGLDQFAATTSLELKNTISDETGSGALVFATSPALVTPDLGTPSAVDLTNATNTPLPASGTVTEAMLNVSTNASLDLADSAIQTETNGTVQGTGATTYNIVATDEGAFASTTPRGENSVDLQTNRDAVTQVSSGANSALVGGNNNTASNTGSAVIGGNTNTAAGLYSGVVAGQRNEAAGLNSIVLGGSDSTASGIDSLAAGDNATVTHNGARVFADADDTNFPSIANNEFAVQASALRLVDGTTLAAGNVLTSDANGSGNWAAPAKVVYTVATLPATPAQGDVAIVTDATANTFHSVVAGTGSNIVPVFNDGTDWRIG